MTDTLLTGATGYVGGQLLRRLAEAGHPPRCFVRRFPEAGMFSGLNVEYVIGDMQAPASLESALQGIRTAYYLVHSMDATRDFEALDRTAARNFSRAAAQHNLERIIYLGGLGDSQQELSPHLRSRQEVGCILAESGVPVIEFRASIVIGPGSLSFEMIRALVGRLPVLITPRWVSIMAQPIAIHDLLNYLMAALEISAEGHRIFEIGGKEQVSYRDLMQAYAHRRGLHRMMISVPVLTPRLSSLWLGLVTPLHARVGRRLIDSLRHPTVVRDPRALAVFPAIQPCGIREAIEEALRERV